MRRYFSAAVEQALWSILNLGVNLALARFLAPHAYGGFVFWANCAFALASLQNALTICHLQVLAPGAGTESHRLGVERLMLVVNAIFLAVVALAILASGMLVEGDTVLTAPEAALFVPAFLLQQYVRALAFSRGKPAVAAWQTGIVLLLCAGLITALLILGPKPPTAGGVMLCMGVAYGVVGLGGLAVATAGQWRGKTLVDLRTYGMFARNSGWVFLGVSSTELLARFYAFVVAAWYGPSALAILAATQLFMRPIPLLAGVWSVVARPRLARQRDDEAWSEYGRATRRPLLFGVPFALAWTAVVFFSWPLICTFLFAGKYGEYAWMAALWGLSSTLGFGQAVVSASLQVLREFKRLALANAAASLVAAGGVLMVMKSVGYGGAIVGMAAGQALELLIMLCLLGTALARGGRAFKAP